MQGTVVGRVVYYLRTTPVDMLRPFIDEFDDELRAAFEQVVGFSMSETQWDQASLGVKQCGIGLCRASDIADAAYSASRAEAFEDYKSLDRLHVRDDCGREVGDIISGMWMC